MRSYGQFCGVAKALDVVGDRWTMLIVRELLIRGPSRYSDLQAGLPGIATNLLAERLRWLEEAGVIERATAPAPTPAALFRLTERGRSLEPVVEALGRWGGPLLAAPAPKDAFRSHWLALPLRIHLADRAPRRPPIAIEVRTGDAPLVIEARGGELRVRPGSAERPDAVVTGAPRVVVGLMTGRLSLGQARARGLRYEGSPEALERVVPVTGLR